MEKNNPITIPEEVGQILDALQKADFESFLVGGSVRDILLGQTPKDWDIATNATPEEVVRLFPHTHYENEFGTVGIVNDDTEDSRLKTVEVTTYRLEGRYSDKRRPDEVEFAKNIEDDLKRRDFTINALALSQPVGERGVGSGNLVDLFGGMGDLKDGVIRAVGDPKERFKEDALRMMRAVRLASELDFEIEEETKTAISNESQSLEEIAKERIRDEFQKIILSKTPSKGMWLLLDLNLLPHIAPELLESIGVEQGGAHKYDVFEHLLRALDHAAYKDYSLEVRLAALFHDIAKPHTRRKRSATDKKEWSFFGHEVVGARITRKILERLRFPKEVVQKVTTLVRWHMFFSDTEEITLSAVRRMIRNVEKENVWELMDLRTADRIGAGRPKEKPYRLRKYQSMIEEALRDPISVGQLKIKGDDVIDTTGEKPGPRIGWILHALLDEVLEDPKKNTEDYLKEKVIQLSKMPDEKLRTLGKKGELKKDMEEEKEIQDLREKYHVE